MRIVIDQAAPDVLLLTDFDYDLDGAALGAFADLFDGDYPYRFAAQPNSGVQTDLDLDQNGRTGEPRDALGYGRFAGDGGLAILSRYPIGEVDDLSDMLWRDLPGATMPAGYYADEVIDILRLSSTAHWIVPIDGPDGRFHLLAFGATPPVFDGPEDRNGLRNRDELRMWEWVLDGGNGTVPSHFLIAGNANLDAAAGNGMNDAMAAFLSDPRLQDPLVDQPNADWSDRGPGKLRVSYVLPAATWDVVDAGTFWPTPEDRSFSGDHLPAGPHHLVWVDIVR
ncbi:endonuclease/exonuclease/phosphatase family protein [Yoonia sp. 2307UL14-13]|uniref:endonuclease/exonuclease/phosphatase family protein n=1 Tax=Yoonia sp. 2307UL14-13 TaxID=3126506 RepID=UPI0030AA186D